VTPYQEAIIKARIENPQATQAEIANKLRIKQPRISETLAKPHVQVGIREAMEAQPCLRNKALAKTLAEKTKAKTVKVFQTKNGEIVYSKPLGDHGIQLQAVKLALELKGDLKNSVEIPGLSDLAAAIREARERRNKK